MLFNIKYSVLTSFKTSFNTYSNPPNNLVEITQKFSIFTKCRYYLTNSHDSWVFKIIKIFVRRQFNPSTGLGSRPKHSTSHTKSNGLTISLLDKEYVLYVTNQ